MKKWIRVFVFSGVFSLLAFSQEFRVPDYRGWVNDFAHIVSYSYEEKLDLLASEVKRKTGVEMVVVTVENMGGLTVEDYSSRLFASWGIGERGKDNGILFFLALEERRMRIEVGYGLEGILPDGLVGEIRDRDMLPDFRTGDYGRGFYRGMVSVADIVGKGAGVSLSDTEHVERPSRSPRESGGGIVTLVIFIVLIILTRGRILPWLFLGAMMGGGRRGGGFSSRGGGFGGGFGGFGGGMSGGGGASGRF